MWGLDKDARYFVPDEAQQDRTMRSQAVKSLTSAAGSSIPKDKDSRGGGGEGGDSEGGLPSGGQLPWGSYLEKKREKDREREGKRSASKGGGWLPFWKSTGLGRLDHGWVGGGAMQLASISISLERRASYESQAKQSYDRGASRLPSLP